MANKSKELGKLFKDYVLRSAEEKKKNVNISYGGSYRPLGCRSNFNGGMVMGGNANKPSDNFVGVIYFYEWSDTSNPPKTFFTIDAFSRFLSCMCGITLQGFEREIIEIVHTPFIACKKGSKELIIRKNFIELSKELKSESKINVPCCISNSPNGNWFG